MTDGLIDNILREYENILVNTGNQENFENQRGFLNLVLKKHLCSTEFLASERGIHLRPLHLEEFLRREDKGGKLARRVYFGIASHYSDLNAEDSRPVNHLDALQFYLRITTPGTRIKTLGKKSKRFLKQYLVEQGLLREQ